MNKKIKDIDLIQMKDISFEEFKSFNDSLTIERETWSLDFNLLYKKTNAPIKDLEEYYDLCVNQAPFCTLFTKIDNKIAGLIQINLV